MEWRETQKSISDWAEETFGAATSNLRVAVRANEEMAELLRELTIDFSPEYDARKAVEECADTYIVLCRLGERLGLNLLQSPSARAIRHEMPIGSRPFEIAVKANVLIAKAMLLLSYKIQHKVTATTASEVAGLLEWIVEKLGGDLHVAVDSKMEVNRRRRWRVDGSGHGYHLKERERDI